MYTYILTIVILFIVASCLKSSFPKKFLLLGCAIISLLICIVVNCLYFSVNYDTMETKTKYETKVFDNENITFKIKEYSVIRIGMKNSLYDITIQDKESDYVLLDTINKLTKVNIEFVDDNQWVMVSSYPYKKTNKIISLKKENYDIFKTYQDSICKRKDTLQKNG